MSDEEAQTIVDQALASGSLRQRNTIAVVVGIVGSGKTWLIHRLFQLNPPDRGSREVFSWTFAPYCKYGLLEAPLTGGYS